MTEDSKTERQKYEKTIQKKLSTESVGFQANHN